MDTIFLVLSLFLPRLTLFLFYFFLGGLPPNTVPKIGDLMLGIFLPRVLVIIYIVQNLGTDKVWFWLHIVVAIFVYFFSGDKYRRRRRKNS